MAQRERETGTATADDLVRMARRAAVRAPPPHNTQPWRFPASGDRDDGAPRRPGGQVTVPEEAP